MVDLPGREVVGPVSASVAGCRLAEEEPRVSSAATG
jgi:hypothetical protein